MSPRPPALFPLLLSIACPLACAAPFSDDSGNGPIGKADGLDDAAEPWAGALPGPDGTRFRVWAPNGELLNDLSSGQQVHLALIAPDGSFDGALSAALVEAGRDAHEMIQVSDGARSWLIQSHPVPGLAAAGESIATLLVARPVDVGITGLFPHAWTALILIGIAAVLLLGLAIWRARIATR